MGDPKKQRKKYETSKFPWRIDTLDAELKLLGQYGLRNKRELWRHKTLLSKFRGNARELLGKPKEERKKLEEQLVNKLKRLGMLSETDTLDQVLDLSVEDIMERRLQTIVFRKSLAKSIHQARQLITHGHIVIKNRRVSSPSNLVFKDDENYVSYSPASALSNPNHPISRSLISESKENNNEQN